MTLSQDQIDFYWENGYLPYDKILDDETIEILRHEYDAEFERARQAKSLNNLAAGAATDDETPATSSVQMLQIMQMCERNIHFRRLCHHAKILDAVQDLIGPNLMLFHDQALFKPAHTGGAVFWHQDNAYWKCRPATLISCWLTLDDVDKENGAMQIIPGSHLKPTIHGSNANTSERWRRGLTIRYIPTSTRITVAPWPSAFLLRDHAVPGINDYLPIPRFIVGQHMEFAGAR